MGKRFQIHHERRLCRIAIILLALLMEMPLNGCKRKADTTSKAPIQIQQEPSSSNSNDRLLRLELIGYMNAIDNFSELTVEETNSKISAGEDFLLFVGRPTCEWCRKLAPSLQEVSADKGLEIFYLDSTNTETDSELSNFRALYDIPTVPAIIHFKENGTFTKIDLDLESDNIVVELSSLINPN